MLPRNLSIQPLRSIANENRPLAILLQEHIMYARYQIETEKYVYKAIIVAHLPLEIVTSNRYYIDDVSLFNTQLLEIHTAYIKLEIFGSLIDITDMGDAYNDTNDTQILHTTLVTGHKNLTNKVLYNSAFIAVLRHDIDNAINDIYDKIMNDKTDLELAIEHDCLDICSLVSQYNTPSCIIYLLSAQYYDYIRLSFDGVRQDIFDRIYDKRILEILRKIITYNHNTYSEHICKSDKNLSPEKQIP